MVQCLKTLVFLAKAQGSTPNTQIAFPAIQNPSCGESNTSDLRHQTCIQNADIHANKTLIYIKLKKL